MAILTKCSTTDEWLGPKYALNDLHLFEASNTTTKCIYSLRDQNLFDTCFLPGGSSFRKTNDSAKNDNVHQETTLYERVTGYKDLCINII